MSNNNTLLTHKALAALLGVSETTIKSYRRKFPDCIPVANTGKPIRFKPEAAEVASRIRDLFSIGMAVADVREQLSKEFTWIKNTSPKKKETNISSVDESQNPLFQNIIKSLVLLSQQQQLILQRMKGVENFVEELQQAGIDLKDIRLQSQKIHNEQQNVAETKISQLELIIQENTRYFSELVKHVEGIVQSINVNQLDEMQQENKVARHHFLYKNKVIGNNPFTQAISKQPPRIFFTLPLLTSTAEGQLVSAGGRSRGRFCLNDLKAMLVYGVTPPNHYTLQWEQVDRGWWLYLSQPDKEKGKQIQMLLEELPAVRGENCLVVTQLKSNGELVHPVTICALIDSLHDEVL